MASAWGASWGKSWGNAWGLLASVVPEAAQDDPHGRKKRRAHAELSAEEVRAQWELLDLRTRANTPEIPEGSLPGTVLDQQPINNAIHSAATISGELTIAIPANYQEILTSSPTDSAGEPLAPDQAAAAIEARRQRNNKALAMLLMEL